ncbi:MAG: DoxX family protein [Gemmatimonadetes bacterium]|nr:DoxX family protein [Gemmatimonadota bacterium]
MDNVKQKLKGIGTWILVILQTLTMGMAGFAKLGPGADWWQTSFISWGYASWFSTVIGILELIGALALLVPKLTSYAAGMLIVIMTGALSTVITNDSSLGVLAPTMHIVISTALLALRWKKRLGGPVHHPSE